MSLEEIFWVAMALVVMIVLPVAAAVTVWQQLRATKPGQQGEKHAKSGGGAYVPLGNALQELDRLVARPSVEFTVEAERPILKRDDDQGGK